MKVTVNCSLMIGNREQLSPGHIFEGQLEDFPVDIQNLVKKKSKFLIVVPDLGPKPTPRAVKVAEEEKVVSNKPRVKLKSKKRP